MDKDDYLPPKKFMWDIFSTLDSDLAIKFVRHSIEQRTQEVKEGDKTIEVSEEVLNDMKSVKYFTQKKGKALYMLKANKKYTNVKRKRRREFISYDPENQEEEKEPTGKRIKTKDSDHTIVGNPFKKKRNVFLEEKEIRVSDKNSEETDMNIDNYKKGTMNPNPF
uniref:ORF3 n=1 Tax=Euplotes crassus TaxID=5936 RepID=V9GZH9_EUPCR|nr:ORF3 [Moneuplotes crassus]